MNKQVTFCHGALSDPYEEQANAQGFTLGDKAERRWTERSKQWDFG